MNPPIELKLPETFNLSGRVAVITGGSGMLGVQHALALLQVGARVALADIDLVKAEEKAKFIKATCADYSIEPFHVDVTSEDSAQKCCDEILDKFGGVDVLINNAAIDPKVSKKTIQDTQRMENLSVEEWNNQINVGLTGAFICSKIFGSFMASNSGGVILNISSDLSIFAPDQRLYEMPGIPKNKQQVKPVTYPVIKTALVGLTRYLATYWNEQGVRANALSPGGVFVDQNDEFVSRFSKLVPLGRMAFQDEYQAAIQFLCSDASSYMTGQNIVMDGGRSVW